MPTQSPHLKDTEEYLCLQDFTETLLLHAAASCCYFILLLHTAALSIARRREWALVSLLYVSKLDIRTEKQLIRHTCSLPVSDQLETDELAYEYT